MTELHTKNLFACMLMFIIHLLIMKPMVIDGLGPQGVDVIASKGESHQTSNYKKRTGEVALWNPYLFSGMPKYMRLGPQTPSVDTIINFIGNLIGNMFLWYIVGSLGFFFFMRYMGLSVIASFAGAMAFTLLPHYQSLWIEGHNVKFRAVMAVPWVAFTSRYFFDTRSIIGAALFALSYGNQIRTQHYQVVFYTSMLVFAIGIAPILTDLIKYRINRFFKTAGLLFCSIAFALMLAAQPLFLAGEYLPYSTRGSYTTDINLEVNPTKKNKGLDFQSATQWSTHPSSLISWIIPRFEGGMSSEIYKGENYPHLKGRSVPGYWGHMPFTQSYEFFGSIIIMLALLGFIQNRKNILFISLGLCALIFLLLSFGRHFEGFYKIFFNYVPFYKNFRAPMMSITLTGFIICMFSAFGFQILEKNISLKHKNNFLVISLLLIIIGILTWLGSSQLSFQKIGEQQYTPEIKTMIISIRRELLIEDVFRYFIIVGISILIVIGAMINKISKLGAVISIIVLMGLDLISIQMRKPVKFVNIKRLEKNHFQKTGTDQFLLKNPGPFRILPVGKLFGDNRWSYFHQNAGGYSAIKMNRMEEILKNSLYAGSIKDGGLNQNILKILNVHYVVALGIIDSPNFSPVYKDSQTGWMLFEFKEKIPRGYFVGNVETIEEASNRLRRLNSATFNPMESAIIETTLNDSISNPVKTEAKITKFSPNKINWKVSTDVKSLFVMSETPYKPGWKARLGNKEIDILTVNHVNMGVVIPKGDHKLSLVFYPDSYYLYDTVETISAVFLYVIIIGGVFSRRSNLYLLNYKK